MYQNRLKDLAHFGTDYSQLILHINLREFRYLKKLGYLAVWHSGNVIRCMNEVTQCQARSVLELVTVIEQVYHLGM